MANRKGQRRRFGSVRQLKSGRWQARYRDPATGQLRGLDRTFATKKDAEVALSQVEADISRGLWVDPDEGRIPFGDFMTDWFRDRKLADRTRERHESVIRLHIMPTFEKRALISINTTQVRAWRTSLLAAEVGEPTVVKAYQILRAAFNTAVDDELIRRNPCRIKGADSYDVPERPVLSVAEVFATADAISPRYRLLVLFGAFTTLRFGELASLRRRDVDVATAALMVRRSQAEMQTGALFDKAPKSEAGVRPVAFPTELLPDVKQHLDAYAGSGRDGHVFLGPQGGQLRRSNFRDDWIKARTKAGITADAHFHDLRHTGNTLAASGASLRELMTRMGHSTPRAALIYQHVVGGRDREIADRLGSMIRKTRGETDS
ncbi:tyrosine-type recombinase/integrase [Streptomyces sp. NPDC046853]|uniref:tyrosine-type recombinase/integrase n=1 Tax=Streptomyces sp. NPDC046853 TaxID=3154920 RepID=UPI0034109AB4